MKTDKKLIPIGKAAEFLGVSIMTLRRWDASKKLPATKSPSGYRYYELEELKRFSENLFDLAGAWVASEASFDISKDYYCDTHDSFRARLEHMAITISQEKRTTDLASLLTAITAEIGNNSFDHNLGNWPDMPGIFFAYDINKRIIVLADRGVGIKATLLRVRPNLKDDLQALKTALTERISGRAPEQRGNGLKFVVSVTAKNPIKVSLQSGKAVAKIERKIEISLAPQSISGTLTKIEY